ncbi:GFA family protein [uncultured Desulfuromonas sp.]|uniref:GFA family protein n=1 Tax=uncultured Desulfuromonas sp. TaxID=181013 RepID=UPI002AAAC287|nr:GFA family protein [uncultured Desulfuromonas sp.]
MDTKTTGSCLCGEVTFEITGPFTTFFLCHCERCRKDTGSAHAANLFSTSAKLTWLSGEQNITTFTLPETRHSKSFCTICGSALPIQLNKKLIQIPAGSLDSDVTMRPTAHIFLSDKANWDHDLDDVAKFETLPG